jgi:microcystin-dependent protein
MADQFIGEIRVFPYDFAPYQWQFCNGQLLPITQFSALFSLLGTAFGGNGTTVFGLPNLQGRVPVGIGTAPGLSPYSMGQVAGDATVTLNNQMLPNHSHVLLADVLDPPDSTVPTNASLSKSSLTNMYSTQTSPIMAMAPGALVPVGVVGPHNNMMPYLTLNFCISMSGVYPVRP